VAQHLWNALPANGSGAVRACEVCRAWQFHMEGTWTPEVYSICPGDDDDGGRCVRPRPFAPAGSPRMLEDA
jgi:hypothetical protein